MDWNQRGSLLRTPDLRSSGHVFQHNITSRHVGTFIMGIGLIANCLGRQRRVEMFRLNRVLT